MQNNLAAKPPPDTRFEARQPAGAALLFFIENDSLFVAREVFHPAHGWQRTDLSGARIAHAHPGARCTAFASALSVPSARCAQAIHLALVVNDAEGDHLYLSLSNAATDVAAGAAPAWVAYPFDAGPAPQRLRIARVQIGDASDRGFVVVDTVIEVEGAAPRQARYWIDAGSASPQVGPRWIAHTLPIDHAGVYASCLGRSRGGWDVDGVYLAGTVGDEAQLLYAPLYNPFNPPQPRWSRRLDIPGKLAAEAIAACRNADNTADLYATAGGALYYFSATNQNECAEALTLISAPAFADVHTLFATSTGGRVTVWGLNRGGQVICTSAPQVYVADPASWNAPSVILSNVEAIAPSPDGDGVDYAFFARTGNGLVKVTKSPGNSRWVSTPID
jgi:hypothetical protein